MSCVLVLCVVLLVSQVEMIPVQPVGSLALGRPVGPAALASPQEVESVLNVNGDLARVKRAALANAGENKCSNGMIELWYGGPCVTCEK